MKFIATASSLLIAIVFAASCARGGGHPLMIDPLIGLEVDQSSADLEKAPSWSIPSQAGKRGTYWWVFASARDPNKSDREFNIVSGLAYTLSDTDPPQKQAVEPDFGWVGRREGSTYVVLGVPDRMYDDLGLSSEVIDALCRNAVARLERIHGGRENLQLALDRLAARSKSPELAEPILRALKSTGVNVSKFGVWIPSDIPPQRAEMSN